MITKEVIKDITPKHTNKHLMIYLNNNLIFTYPEYSTVVIKEFEHKYGKSVVVIDKIDNDEYYLDVSNRVHDEWNFSYPEFTYVDMTLSHLSIFNSLSSVQKEKYYYGYISLANDISINVVSLNYAFSASLDINCGINKQCSITFDVIYYIYSLMKNHITKKKHGVIGIAIHNNELWLHFKDSNIYIRHTLVSYYYDKALQLSRKLFSLYNNKKCASLLKKELHNTNTTLFKNLTKAFGDIIYSAECNNVFFQSSWLSYYIDDISSPKIKLVYFKEKT